MIAATGRTITSDEIRRILEATRERREARRDSSVCIPALLADHEDHHAAQAALSEADLTIAHAAMETYSVLTRLPPPLRVSGAEAAALIAARLPDEWIVLDAATQADTLQLLRAQEWPAAPPMTV